MAIPHRIHSDAGRRCACSGRRDAFSVDVRRREWQLTPLRGDTTRGEPAFGYLTATAVSDYEIDLAWTNPSPPPTNDFIYLYSGSDCSSQIGGPNVLGAPSTSYDWEGFPADSTFSFEVTAVDSAGEGPPSNCAAATTFSLPPAPSGLTATAASVSEIDLLWTNPVGPLTDNFLYLFSGSDCSSQIGGPNVLGTPATSYAWVGFPANSTFSFEVSAVNSTGEGPPSNCATAATFGLPPAPTGLTAAAVSTTEIDLLWTNPVGPLTDNFLYLFSGSDCSSQVGGPNVLGTPATSYAWVGFPVSSTFSFEVSAVNSTGEGPQSGCASATTFGLPPAPTGLTATGVSTTEIDLTWTNPVGPLTADFLYLFSGSGCSSQIGGPTVLGAPTTSYAWVGFPVSSTFSFEVSAVNSTGEGPQSGCANAATLSDGPIQVPTGTTVTGGELLTATPPTITERAKG